jgi:NADPH:quinone reductase-like Zn-dependent oxidoreductase
MQGWVVRGKGDPSEVFEWREAPEPSHEAMRALTVDLAGLRTRQPEEPPASAYVFVRVLAAALATPDVTMATGEYPVPIERPYVSGQEAVGIVEETSPGLEHWMGKRVMGFTPQPFGSFAPRAVMFPPMIYEVPEGMSDADAAGFVIRRTPPITPVHRAARCARARPCSCSGAAAACRRRRCSSPPRRAAA